MGYENVYSEIEVSFIEINKAVSRLIDFKRNDKKYELNLYEKEYSRLSESLKKAGYPSYYEHELLKHFYNRLLVFAQEVKKLISYYTLLETKKNALESEYNLAQRQELIYQSMKGITQIMRIYLCYDKFILFDKALQELEELAVALVEKEDRQFSDYQRRYNRIREIVMSMDLSIRQHFEDKIEAFEPENIDLQNIYSAYNNLENFYLEIRKYELEREFQLFQEEIGEKTNSRISNILTLRL